LREIEQRRHLLLLVAVPSAGTEGLIHIRHSNDTLIPETLEQLRKRVLFAR
jgi:hypothetical protein